MNREALMINQTDRQLASQPPERWLTVPAPSPVCTPVLLQRAQSASSREAAVASGRGVFLLGQPTRWMRGAAAAAVSLLAGINYLRIQARVHPQLCLSVTERVYIVNRKDG